MLTSNPNSSQEPARLGSGQLSVGPQLLHHSQTYHPTDGPTTQDVKNLAEMHEKKLRSIFDISECHTLNSELLWTLIQHTAQVQNVQSVALMSRKIVKS